MRAFYDFVVIGAGSAGCTVTNRLIKAGKSVLLLEEGPSDRNFFVQTPATFVRVIGTDRSFIYEGEANPNLDGRAPVIPQGRMLGGGSSLNAMIYIRGQRQDYDNWASNGASGWDYDSVLPVYRRLERNMVYGGPFHGQDGILPVSNPRYRHQLSSAFIEAGAQAGYPLNSDFNGAQQEGIGFFQTTILNGRRQSTAATFLKEVRNSPLLDIQTSRRVVGLTFENGAASGVVVQMPDNSRRSVEAREGVILTAGSLATPKILMHSGIGPGEHLQAMGITVRVDAPGVGQNFQDHVACPVYGLTHDAISLLGQDKGLKALKHGLQYILTKRGLLSSNVVESGGFLDLDGDGRPDVQLHTLPVLVSDAEHHNLEEHGIEISPCILRPKSRGRVSLRTPDPHDPIILDSGFLNDPDDIALLRKGVKAARRILRQPALQKLVKAELAPSADDECSDAALDAYIRGAAKTVYHPVGTCKMGNDRNAVVDPQLRVRGVPRLWICDASIMPEIVSGNTNAPTIMIADRCADFILETIA